MKINYTAHKRVIERHIKAAGKLLSVRTIGGVEVIDGMEVDIPGKVIEFYAVEDKYTQYNTVQGVSAGDNKYYCIGGSDVLEIQPNDFIHDTNQVVISVQVVEPGDITTHYIISTKVYGS